MELGAGGSGNREIRVLEAVATWMLESLRVRARMKQRVCNGEGSMVGTPGLPWGVEQNEAGQRWNWVWGPWNEESFTK